MDTRTMYLFEIEFKDGKVERKHGDDPLPFAQVMWALRDSIYIERMRLKSVQVIDVKDMVNA